MQDWSHYGKGYVRIKAYTQSPERFLNLCAYHKIKVWNLVNKNDIYEMNLSIQDFFRLKSICKKTGTIIQITGKYGLPFFFYRNKKRKAFFIGIFLSFFILFFLSGYIWNIHVEGNVHNSTQSILGYLERIDVHHGASKKKLDCALIAEKLRGEFPNITWVSAKITGSRLLLEIKENDNIYKEKIPEKGAYDLIADKTGKIVSMVTRKGTPLKKTGELCKKGEILVSGRLDILNDSKEIEKYEYTDADADIYVEYPLEYYQQFSMTYQKPIYTGKQKKGYLLQVGDYYFDFKRKPPWETFDTTTNLKQLYLTENFKLPIFYGSSTDYEYQTGEFVYTEKEAREKVESHLSILLKSLEEKGVQISENHVKINIQKNVCTASGTLLAVEKAGKKAPTDILPQQTERNFDINE